MSTMRLQRQIKSAAYFLFYFSTVSCTQTPIVIEQYEHIDNRKYILYESTNGKGP